ncbi:CDK5 and ABL1 enzyme substrate 1 [Alosa alosa]|uniref:CDK5 and ABL1 enzyme substrate 1 n=1 Tax=Alosa alosa TaxID=278164 RepID=UPI0020151409|nr:CDK5 and ABL1 enzyme substrate 1 [Alosa alosa]
MDPVIREAALHFLRNISLDGLPPQRADGEVLLGAEMRSEVATSTRQHHSGITTAIVHSGARDLIQSDDAPVGQVTTNSRIVAEAASDISSHPPPFHLLSGAVKGRFTPGAQRGHSGSLKKQTHSFSDSQGSSSLELQRTRRRHTLQRFETLQAIEENAPLRRCSSSSSRQQKSSKRVHFIKNMRQHDTSNGRIILISIRRALFCVFSLIPYREYSHDGDVALERRHQHPSGAIATKEMVVGLEGVELGAKGKTVSYTQLLYPTHALSRDSDVGQQSSSDPVYPAAPCGFRPMSSISTNCKEHTGADRRDRTYYDPNLLDDPHWPCGKHKRVLVFPSYMTTVIEYTKPSDLKRDMNDTFREKFPHIQLTLSKIRSLKKEIRKLAQEDCGYEEPIVAMAFVYFEKLALRGKLDKENRKLCAGACILLAAKIGSDLKTFEVKQLIDRLEERLRLNRRELLAFEFPVLVALEFNLYLSDHELLPHYRRLLQTA